MDRILVVEKIFAFARAKPDRIALYYGLRPVSYAAFAAWIAQAREILTRQEIRPSGVAVLDVDSLLDSWVFGLALQSLGLTTMSVPSLEKLDELRASDIACIVTTIRDRAPQIPATGSHFRAFRIPHHFCLRTPAGGVPEPFPMAESGAHILLTSGTTGASKKVLIGRDYLSTHLSRRAETYGYDESSVVNIFGYAMRTGGGYKVPCCVWSLGGAVIMHQGEDFHRSLEIGGITHARANPAILAAILAAPENELHRRESMRLTIGGAQMSPAMAEKAQRLLTPHLFTTIGSTEIGTWAITRIESAEDLRSHRIAPGSEVQIVGEADEPVPTGRMGLVRVRCAGMTTAYLDDPDATRQFFRHGFFYPGDLGSMTRAGRLVLHGRATNVLNAFGDKLAAEPIERALPERLAAKGVCVFSVPAEGNGEVLHIAIETREPIAKADLTASIRAEIPRFPDARVHFVASLPRAMTGKIDRLALRRQLLGKTEDA